MPRFVSASRISCVCLQPVSFAGIIGAGFQMFCIYFAMSLVVRSLGYQTHLESRQSGMGVASYAPFCIGILRFL
jgi:hypothetical protein